MALRTTLDYVNAVFFVIYFAIAQAGAVANGLCLFAIVKQEVLQKNHAYKLIALLCLVDVLTGIGAIGGGCMMMLSYSRDVSISQLACYFLCLPTLVSQGSNVVMLSMAAERCYIVAFPLSYQQYGNHAVQGMVWFNVVLGAACGVAFAVGVEPGRMIASCSPVSVNNNELVNYTTKALRYPPMILCCLLYLLTLLIYRKKKGLMVAALSGEHGASFKRQQTAITKTISMICLTYMLGSVVGVLLIIDIGPIVKAYNLELGTFVTIFGTLLFRTNLLLNAFIFPWKNEDIRRAMKKALRMADEPSSTFAFSSDHDEGHVCEQANQLPAIAGRHEQSPRYNVAIAHT